MVKFLDGPAEGQVLALRRAPLLLRVVRDQAGEFDALDQLEDEPREGEAITVYRRIGEAARVHLKMRKGSGWYQLAEYRVLPVQPLDQVARRREGWQAWARTAARVQLEEV